MKCAPTAQYLEPYEQQEKKYQECPNIARTSLPIRYPSQAPNLALDARAILHVTTGQATDCPAHRSNSSRAI
eukprot:3586468-Pyramimonas_sp.AAC.2